MSLEHIAHIMHDFLHRGVERESSELLQLWENSEFFTAPGKPYAVNLLAFAIGVLQPNENWTDMDEFGREDLLQDRKLYKGLLSVVDRMPTLQFQFIPLVMLYKDQLQTTFLMRVRKTATSTEDCVFVDMANRKYDKFDEFLTANKLPTCTLWYPKDGLIRYTVEPPSSPRLMLQIESRRIERMFGAWDIVTTTGMVVGSALSITPLAPTVGLPLLFVSSAVSSGFSIANLVDSCKYERGQVIATRALAVAFSLTAFASTGLTVACRVEKIRRLIPADTLLKLERAEQLMSAGLQKATPIGIVTMVIGSLRGWETLSTAELLELGALLCFAHRETFTMATAERLFHALQHKGVVKFFQTTCPNVMSSVLNSMTGGPAMEHYLRLVTEFLQNYTDFKVDDQFVTITLFGYEMRFEQLFEVRWSQLKMLFQYLQTFKQNVGNITGKVTKPWTQEIFNEFLNLLTLVGRLKDVPCTLADYIMLGPGHRFSFATLHAFFRANDLDRMMLLRLLATFSCENTERLNELREKGHFEGGDLALFNWLGRHRSLDYHNALMALIDLAAYRESAERQVEPLKFEEKRIIVSPLLTIEAEEFYRVPSKFRELLVRDERFLKFCKDAKEDVLPRANRVWIRTCCDIDTVRQLESIELLKELFQNDVPHSLQLQLVDALDTILTIEDITVPQVYYRVLFFRKQCAVVPLDNRTVSARFQSLLDEARTLNMIGYYRFSFEPDYLEDDEKVIAKVRTMLPGKVAGSVGLKCAISFGTPERAACWLVLLPVLRNTSFRVLTYQAIVDVLATGNGTVMELSTKFKQEYAQMPEKKMIQFTKGDHRVIIEVLYPEPPELWIGMRASFYLCGSSFN